MLVRFEKAPPADAGDHREGTCSWCGFRAASGIRSYAEDGGAEASACGPCFAARHADGLDPDLFRLAWIPEVPQADLAHLARTVAVLLVRHGRGTDRRQRPEVIKISQSALAVSNALARRADGVTKATARIPGGVKGAAAAMEPGAADALMRGMRVLPVAFEADEVSGWVNDDSSLNGYGTDMLGKHSWFCADLGLAVPPGSTAPPDFGFPDSSEGDRSAA